MNKDALLLALAILLFPLIGNASVVGSPHDFTPLTGGLRFQGSSDEVCTYCHTPHNALSQDGSGNKLPLWNRTLNEGASFTMYSNPGSLDASMPGRPSGHSLLCLSCHDGITALGSVGTFPGILNAPSGAIIFNGGSIETMSDATTGLPGDPIALLILGRDLSNDHPISFVYNNALAGTDQALNLPADDLIGSNLSPLKLYNQKIECGTCHDPHDNDTAPPFLRMSNANSAMCNTCHIK